MQRRLMLAALAAFVAGVGASAAPITIEVVSASVSSTAACAAGGFSATDTAACAGLPDSYSFADTRVEGGAVYNNFGGFFDNGYFLTVASRASAGAALITANVVLRTDGPTRWGFADFFALGGPFGCAAPGCAASVAVDSIAVAELGGYRGRPPYYSVPVLLGGDISIALSASAASSGFDAVTASLAGIDIQFRDAPATRTLGPARFALVSEAPEPGPLSLVAAGLALCLAGWRGRATSK